MNEKLAADVVREFVQPAFDQDGRPCVAFFDKSNKMHFCIPAKSESDCLDLVAQFQDFYMQTIRRYSALQSYYEVHPLPIGKVNDYIQEKRDKKDFKPTAPEDLVLPKPVNAPKPPTLSSNNFNLSTHQHEYDP